MTPPQKLTFLSESQNARWQEIRGWLLPEAAEELYRHVRNAPPSDACVEIGSYAGKSTVCILQAMMDRGDSMDNLRLTALDLRFQPDFHGNLVAFGHESRVRAVSGPNIDAFESWNTPIGFLYIDGHHGKGHSLADLLTWDLHVVEGGIVALDDTAGFMVGPNLQIQVAVRSGCYELLTEAGGISFLRKIKPILPVGEATPSEGALMAELHAISANVGAMDLEFRLPRYPSQEPMPLRGWFDVLLNSSFLELNALIRRKYARFSQPRTSKPPGQNALANLQQHHARRFGILKSIASDRQDLTATLQYLESCFAMRRASWNEALELLTPLSAQDSINCLHHYDIPVKFLALLRVAQCQDLGGAHSEARTNFAALATDPSTPSEIATFADRHVIEPYHLPPHAGNPLLREYNLELYKYKRPVYGATELVAITRDNLNTTLSPYSSTPGRSPSGSVGL